MPNVGVQKFFGQVTLLAVQGGADVTCTAGTTVTVCSVLGSLGTYTAQNPGSAVGVWQGALALDLGATAPTALAITCAITPGTPIATINVNSTFLVASAKLFVPITFVALSSVFGWQLGQTPMIQVLASTTACTLRLNGTAVYFSLSPQT